MPLTKELNTDLIVAEVTDLDAILESLPDYGREDIVDLTEKLLIAELQGKVKLKPNQLSVLNSLSRKYLDNPPTIKEEDDPIDHLALLSEIYQNNTSSFEELTELALSFRDQENRHRDRLKEVKDEMAEEDKLGQHIPVLSSLDTLSKGADLINGTAKLQTNATQGINSKSPEDHRFSQMVDLQADGVLSSWPTDFIPHKPG